MKLLFWSYLWPTQRSRLPEQESYLLTPAQEPLVKRHKHLKRLLLVRLKRPVLTDYKCRHRSLYRFRLIYNCHMTCPEVKMNYILFLLVFVWTLFTSLFQWTVVFLSCAPNFFSFCP